MQKNKLVNSEHMLFLKQDFVEKNIILLLLLFIF